MVSELKLLCLSINSYQSHY